MILLYRLQKYELQVYATMPEQLHLEQSDHEKVAENIKDLAHQLYLNVGASLCVCVSVCVFLHVFLKF